MLVLEVYCCQVAINLDDRTVYSDKQFKDSAKGDFLYMDSRKLLAVARIIMGHTSAGVIVFLILPLLRSAAF